MFIYLTSPRGSRQKIFSLARVFIAIYVVKLADNYIFHVFSSLYFSSWLEMELPKAKHRL